MSHLSASETDRSLDFVAAGQELLGAFDPNFKIVNIDLSRKTNFLDVNDLLIAAGFLLLFGLLKAELAVIHNAADGGLCHRCNLDKVKSALVGLCQSSGNVNYTQLGAVTVNKSDFFV